MNCNDKKYRQVTGRIGIALIVMVFLIQGVLFTVPTIFQELLAPISEKLAYVVAMILQIILYLGSFIFPALLLRMMLKKKGLAQPMRLEFSLPASSLWLVPAGIAICYAGSVLNTYIMQIFVPSDAMGSLVGETVAYQPYQIVLQFIATALVPAVCKELLFRGAVASSLMPYGKGAAVVASSVLFALMHQNPYQLFYTFLAGLVLGYLYVKTGSILCSTILHFCNNATSVLMEVCLANLGEDRGMIYYYIITAMIYLVGAVSIVVYFAIEKKKRKGRFDNGSFGRVIESEEGYAELPLTKGTLLKGFFTPAMIVYFALALVNIFTTVGLLWLVSLVGL